MRVFFCMISNYNLRNLISKATAVLIPVTFHQAVQAISDVTNELICCLNSIQADHDRITTELASAKQRIADLEARLIPNPNIDLQLE